MTRPLSRLEDQTLTPTRSRQARLAALACALFAVHCGRGGPAPDAGISPTVEVGACFFSEPGFSGDHACVTLNAYTTDVVSFDRLVSSGPPLTDRVASVQLFGKVKVALHAEAFGQGETHLLTESAASLPAPIDRAASSFELSDVNECADGNGGCAVGDMCTNEIDGSTCRTIEVCFYDGAARNGTSYCTSSTAGALNLPANLDLRVSSVKISGPVAVTLYLGQGGSGESHTITSDVALGTIAGFDDAVRSFSIEMPGMDALPLRTACMPSTERPPATAARVALTRVYPVNWIAPTGGAFFPGNPTRLYMAEKTGTVSFADPGSVAKTVALDLTAHTYDGLDAGVLNIAFSPAFATDGALYVVYNRTCVDADGAPYNPACPGVNGFVSRIARFTSVNGGVTFDPATEEVILDSWNPVDNHTFGAIVFGADGMMYVGTGDGGNGCPACQANGQDLASLRGKILRLDVTTPPVEGGVTRAGCVVNAIQRYCIPTDNPWRGNTSGYAGEVWAYGMRNPWKIAFDARGRLWAGDVGQDVYEEVNIIERGQNYGWAHREGPACYLGNATQCAEPTLRGPVAWYDHATGGNSITSGHVYRGSIEDLRGAFVFADFVSHRVWALWEDGTHGQPLDDDVTAIAGHAVEQLFTTDEMIEGDSLFVPTFLEDANGELYVVVAGNEFGFNDSVGEIYRFVKPEEASLGDFPTTLSATGCFTKNPWTDAFSVPSNELLPYALNAPFWSDGASKRRYVVLPTGANGRRVAASLDASDGDIDFPNGTVLIKEFMLAGRRVETRFMIRHDDGVWGGYTYRWREDQKDADLLRTDLQEEREDVTWHYPSRAECLQCHGSASGRALGPEVRQLDRENAYWPGRRASELATWSYLGLTEWTNASASELARFPLDEGSGNVVRDALGQLANAQIVGNATWLTSTVRGQSVQTLSFDGATHIETAATSGATRTLAAFIYPTSSADVAYIESVIDADVPGEYGTGFGLDDGTFKVILDDEFWATGVPVVLNQWQHVALVFGEGIAELYVNGARAAMHAYTPGDAGNATYFIGKSRANAAHFHGRMSDVRIFDIALGAADVASLYAGEAPTPPSFSAFPDLVGASGSVTDRARAWLHTNCASCHRPGGNGQGGIDLRFDTAFDDTFLCDTVPQYGTAGIASGLDPRLVAPGAPNRSVLLARVGSTSAQWRMPPISSHVVDAEGLALLTSFISSLPACP